jgi:hypothetical protein
MATEPREIHCIDERQRFREMLIRRPYRHGFEYDERLDALVRGLSKLSV